MCGKFGHITLNCYHRFDHNYQATQSNPTTYFTNFATLSILGDVVWYMDFGATHHLTPKPANLQNSNPFVGPDKVAIGNGKELPILNIGSTSLQSNSCSFHFHNVLHFP